MKNNQDCPFCKIVEGKDDYVVWQDDDFLAFLDTRPCKPGHCLLIPKKHTDYLFDMNEDLYVELFKRAKMLEEPLRNAMNAKRIGIVVVGFAVPHAHLHLIPLNGANELFDQVFPTANPVELKRLQEKLRILY